MRDRRGAWVAACALGVMACSARGETAFPPEPATRVDAPDRGEGRLLAGDATEVTSIALDDRYVYFASDGASGRDGGQVRRAARDGTRVETVAAGLGQPRALRASGAGLFFRDWAGALLRCATSPCGEPVQIAMGVAGDALAVDDAEVFWADAEASAIFRCSAAGCGGAPAVVTHLDAVPASLAADETTLYWSAAASGTIVAVAKRGGAAATIARDAHPRGPIAMDATTLYWLEADAIHAVAKSGGDARVVVRGHPAAQHLVRTGALLAFDEWGQLSRAPVAGGEVDALTSTGALAAMAADESGVFFATGGTLRFLAR